MKKDRYLLDIIKINKLMIKSLIIEDFIMMENYRILLNHTIDSMLEKKEYKYGK